MFLKNFKEFLDTYKKKDPASRSYLEILTCYPGLHAVFFHRISNFFWEFLEVPQKISKILMKKFFENFDENVSRFFIFLDFDFLRKKYIFQPIFLIDRFFFEKLIFFRTSRSK